MSDDGTGAERPPLEVAAAIIRDEAGRYLIARRRHGTHLAGLWELPGGKREPGERLEECLRRELREELGADFRVGERVDTVRWPYPDRTVILHVYRCQLEAGAIAPAEAQELAWVPAERLRDYAFPPADAPVVARLANSAREMA